MFFSYGFVSELTNEDINKLNRGYEILKYGYPDQGHGIRYYGNHILVYDQQKKIPFWVAEHLTTDLLKGTYKYTVKLTLCGEFCAATVCLFFFVNSGQKFRGHVQVVVGLSV